MEIERDGARRRRAMDMNRNREIWRERDECRKGESERDDSGKLSRLD